jgi:dCTP deaminase
VDSGHYLFTELHMILSAQSIRQRGIIAPFFERTKHGGYTFGLGPAGYDVRIAEDITLYAGGFTLASTVEHFDMPTDVLGIVHDKSTWARRGLALQNTVIEPGWRGYLTLELSNHVVGTLYMVAGTPIAQIIFHQLDQATDCPYSGKYQDQEAGPQAARYESEHVMCEDCGVNIADLPSKLCPGCEAYRDHTGAI